MAEAWWKYMILQDHWVLGDSCRGAMRVKQRCGTADVSAGY